MLAMLSSINFHGYFTTLYLVTKHDKGNTFTSSSIFQIFSTIFIVQSFGNKHGKLNITFSFPFLKNTEDCRTSFLFSLIFLFFTSSGLVRRPFSRHEEKKMFRLLRIFFIFLCYCTVTFSQLYSFIPLHVGTRHLSINILSSVNDIFSKFCIEITFEGPKSNFPHLFTSKVNPG